MRPLLWVAVGAVVGQFVGLVGLIARLMYEDWCDARDCRRLEDLIRSAVKL